MLTPNLLTPEALLRFKKLDDLYDLVVMSSPLKSTLMELDIFLASNPQNQAHSVSITGDAGVGKSHAIELLKKRYPERCFLVGRMESGGSEKAVAKTILKAMGDPCWQKVRATTVDLRARIVDNMRNMKIDVLVLDEAQQLINTKNKKVQFDMADWVKTLIDELECHVIFVGLPYLKMLFEVNDQFDRRIKTKINLEPFSWSDKKTATEFAAVVNKMEKTLPVDFEVLTNTRYLESIYKTTQGRIHYVIRFLEAAARKMILRDGHYLTLEYMEAACFELHETLDENPFTILRAEEAAAA